MFSLVNNGKEDCNGYIICLVRVSESLESGERDEFCFYQILQVESVVS